MTYIRGGRYYYRSRREGTRVVTEYLGTGIYAFVQSLYDELNAQRREFLRQQLKAQKRAQREIDQELDRAEADVRTLAAAALLGAGYHNHKGTWRRHRRCRSPR